jgi:hypothetical protein
MSFSSFFPVERYTRPLLPYSGSLGPRFPTFPTDLRRSSVLRSAKTASRPSRSASLAAGPAIPCLLSGFAHRHGKAHCRRHGLCSPGVLPALCMETAGSLKFPSCPFKCVPRSKTPVVSCTLAIACSGLLPSASSITSAFLPASGKLFPQLYIFRDSIARPALSFPPASDSRYRACLWSSLPARWLGFSRMGFACLSYFLTDSPIRQLQRISSASRRTPDSSDLLDARMTLLCGL